LDIVQEKGSKKPPSFYNEHPLEITIRIPAKAQSITVYNPKLEIVELLIYIGSTISFVLWFVDIVALMKTL